MMSSDLDAEEARMQRRLADALDPLLPDRGAEERVLGALRLAAERRDPVLRRRTRFGKWGRRLVPVAVGLALAALIGGSLHLHLHAPSPSREGTRPSRPAPSAAAVSAGPPVLPAGADQRYVWLDYVTLPPEGKPATVHVFDWTGALRASFQIPHLPAGSMDPLHVVTISPDGHVALLSDGAVVDHTGATVGRLTPPPLEGESAQRWGEDDRHLCSASLAPASVVLTLLDPTGVPRPVAVLPDGTRNQGMPPNESWGSDLAVVACSLEHDRAVVVRSTETPNGENPVAIWAVQLSTGRVISTLRVDTVNGIGLIASADGTRLVYSPVTGEHPEKVPGPRGLPSRTMLAPTIGEPRLIDLDTGHTVAEFGQVSIVALNEDGTRVVFLKPAPRLQGSDFRMVDVPTGRVVWSRDLPQGLGGSAVGEMGSSSFIVEVATGRDTVETVSLVLVDSDGRWRDVPSGFAPGEVKYLPNLGG